MYEGCILQTRLSKILNVSADQKTRLSIYFKKCRKAFETLSRAFETLCRGFEGLRENPKLGREFGKFGRVLEKTRPRVCVITWPVLSQSVTVP